MTRRSRPRALLLPALLCLAPLAGALAIPAPGGAQKPGEDGKGKAASVLERAAERYESLDGFCASFEQERIVPLLDQTTRSAGTLCQMPPGYFRMDFSRPEGDLVVADGEHVWMYYPSVNPGQVVRARLGDRGGRTFDFHREFLENPEARFEAEALGTDTVSGRSTNALELRPVREEAGYVRARVWVESDRGLIRKVEIEEENGAIRQVVLSDIRVSPSLDPARFAFEPPEGVRIIRR